MSTSPLAGLLIRPDGTAAMRDVASDLDTLQRLKPFKPATADFGAWRGYVYEETRVRDLPPNLAASDFARSIGWPSGETLRGPAVFLGGGQDDDGEWSDVPPEVVEHAVRVRALA